MSLVCANVLEGIPTECRNGNKYILLKGLVLTTYDFQFDTKADAGDVTKWEAGLVAKTVFPIKNVKEIEDLSGEDVRYESPGQDVKELFEGKRRFKVSLDLTLDQHKVLRSYSGKKLRVFWYDGNNNILGTSPDGAIVKGFGVNFIDAEKLMMPTADTPMFSKLEIQLENSSELDDAGVTIMPYLGTVANRWYPYNLSAVTKVAITQVGSVAANAAVFDVAYKSLSDTDNDGNAVTIAAVTGLDVSTFTNFTFTDGSAPVVPNTMTESATVSGRYTANFTTFTTGTAQIVPTSSQLFESDSTALS